MLGKDEVASKANEALQSNEDETRPPPIEKGLAQDELRPWRGLFSPAPERDSLFNLETRLRTSDLPSWAPFITINPRWSSDDDE